MARAGEAILGLAPVEQWSLVPTQCRQASPVWSAPKGKLFSANTSTETQCGCEKCTAVQWPWAGPFSQGTALRCAGLGWAGFQLSQADLVPSFWWEGKV